MKKILITPLFGMGDTLTCTPALELLKKQKPDFQTTVFVFNKLNYDVLNHNPHIDKLWYYPLKASQIIPGIAHILKYFTFQYDVCINFYPSNRIEYNLFPILCAASSRIGHHYLHKDFSQLNWLKNKTITENPELHCVEENCALLSFFGIMDTFDNIPSMKIYLTDHESNFGINWRQKFRRIKKPIIGVHTGTSAFKGQSQRRWSPDYFAEMINLCPEFHFVLLGSGEEIPLNKKIHSMAKNTDQVSILQGISIREVCSVISQMNGFISNDSGLMHIAAAMGIPTVAILGPTNPAYISPWKVPHAVVRLDIPCSPCFYYSPKPLSCTMTEQFMCLKRLKPHLVVEAAKTLFLK